MKRSDVALLVSLVLCVGIVIVFSIPHLIPYPDERLRMLLGDTIPRLAVSAFLIACMGTRGFGETFQPKWRGRHLLWSIPCFLVAVVNFPFSALICGTAVIERTDLIWLFLLKCVSIALLEEVFFRALLLPLFTERFAKKRHGILLSVLLTSALFALMHLLNLLFGAGLGETAMQVGYTFLIGCMLAVVLIKTKNIWLCVIIHAVFDVGGTIVSDLGSGTFQDMTFWILTAVAGALCAVHIIWSLLKLNKQERM